MNELESQLEKARDHLLRVLHQILRHGHGQFSVRCDVANGKRTKLLITAGVEEQFLIDRDEIERAVRTSSEEEA